MPDHEQEWFIHTPIQRGSTTSELKLFLQRNVSPNAQADRPS